MPPNPITTLKHGKNPETVKATALSPVIGQAISTWLGLHWRLALLMTGFAATTLIVPILGNTAINDDWVYARAVENLVLRGRLEMLDISAAGNVFQTIWGALFARLFGMELGVLRVSTFVIVAIGGFAFYFLCREFSLGSGLSALGTAVYLFHPVPFSLTFTFMSDPHFLSLLVMSAYLYARGIARKANGFLVAGSFFAALAVLVRVQGLLIPAAIATFLLLTRNVTPNLRGSLTILRVVGIPALAAGGFALWQSRTQGVSMAQRIFIEEVLGARPVEASQVSSNVLFLGIMYMGLFLLPLTLPAGAFLHERISLFDRRKTIVFFGVLTALLAGLLVFAYQGRLMPYLPSQINTGGLGPSDFQGDRPPIFGTPAMLFLTLTTAASCFIAVVFVITGRSENDNTDQKVYALLSASLLVFQLAGAIFPSFFFRHPPAPGALPAISLDRYLLPLLPFALCLFLLALNKTRPPRFATGVTIIVMGLVAVTGTRDFLVLHEQAWRLNHKANSLGISNHKLEGGAAWDGYHTSLGKTTRFSTFPPGTPWWFHAYGVKTDSTYVVSTKPLKGYTPLLRKGYSQWLQRRPTYLYLSGRERVEERP